MTLDEIVGLKEDYRAAARRAREAGFDAIEIHGAHGFLLCEFVSPHTNHRTDEYGGDMEGRIRLPLEVIAIVREEVGPDFPLLYRFGASDFLDDGLDLQQAREIAPRLVAAGIDILDISGGLCGSRPKDLAGIQGYFVPMAASIKSVVDVPVIGVGGITDPAFANGFIEEGKVDLVAVGRALLKNPHWAREALAQLAE
jgi:2,4-dienoyl-CoA reductase-like NADH-dependent reductase (Old Yellow Enzyme family)